MKKQLDKVTSPEQLNGYIRASSPRVWAMLAAVIVVLLGVCLWGIFGRLETTLPGTALVENGRAVVTAQRSALPLSDGMTLRLEGQEFPLSGGAADCPQIPDGTYEVQVVERIAPMKFVFN